MSGRCANCGRITAGLGGFVANSWMVTLLVGVSGVAFAVALSPWVLLIYVPMLAVITSVSAANTRSWWNHVREPQREERIRELEHEVGIGLPHPFGCQRCAMQSQFDQQAKYMQEIARL